MRSDAEFGADVDSRCVLRFVSTGERPFNQAVVHQVFQLLEVVEFFCTNKSCGGLSAASDEHTFAAVHGAVDRIGDVGTEVSD